MPNAIQDYLAKRYAPPPDPSGQQYDPGESYLTSALMEPFRLPGHILQGINWVDEGTRNTIYRALAGLGIANDTSGLPSGQNLSGDEFLKRVLGYDTGVGRGERSWAGFGTEALLSPFNLLLPGGVTKAGTAALRLAELTKTAEALRATGVASEVAKAAELEPLINSLSGAGKAGETFAAQGALGQRSAATLHIPFVKSLQGVDLLAPLGDVGRKINQAALAPLTLTNKVAKPIYGPLYDQLLRPVGELASKIPGYQTFNRLLNNVTNPTYRSGEADADVLAGQFRKAIGGVDETDAAARVAELNAIEAEHQFAQAGDVGALITRKGDATNAETLARLQAEQAGQPESLAQQLIDVAQKHEQVGANELARQTAAINAERGAAQEIQVGAIDRARNRLADYTDLVTEQSQRRQSVLEQAFQKAKDDADPVRLRTMADLLEGDASARVANTDPVLFKSATDARRSVIRLAKLVPEEFRGVDIGGVRRSDVVANKLAAQTLWNRADELPKLMQANLSRLAGQLDQLSRSPFSDAVAKKLDVLKQDLLDARNMPISQSRALRIAEAQGAIDALKAGRSFTPEQQALAQQGSQLGARRTLSETLLAGSAPAAEAGNVLRQAMDQGLSREIETGVPVSASTDRYQNYLPHVLAREGGIQTLDKLRELGKAGQIASDSPIAQFAREYNPDKPFTQQRIPQWEGLPAVAKNDMIREATGDPTMKLFEERPQVAVMQRLIDSGKARGDAMLLRGVTEMFAKTGEPGMPVEDFVAQSNLGKFHDLDLRDLPKGKESEYIAAMMKGTPMEGATIPHEIADAALKVNKVLKDEKEWTGLFKVFDGFTSAAKSLYTQIWPQFHIQNAIGDTFSMWLHGFDDPKQFVTATKLLNRISAGTASDAEIALFRRAVENAPVTHTADREAIKLLGENQGLLGKVPGVGKTVKWAASWGNYGENIRKVAMYLDGKAKGLSDLEAGARVESALFDYDKLSGFEKEYSRRLFLFYCVPTDCDILTREGWKKHTDLTIGELVYGLDTETGEAKWTPLLEVSEFDYNGELMTLGTQKPGNRGFFPFTPNHRWPVRWKTMDGSGWAHDVVRGYELRTTHKIPKCATFNDWPVDSQFTEREAAIIGWLITDGTFGKRNDWAIYQSPKKFASEIETLLGSDSCKFAIHPQSGVRMYPIRAALRKVLQAKGFKGRVDAKKIVANLSRSAAAAMWDAMYKADGVTTSCRKIDSFACLNDDVFDAAQMLVHMLGLGSMNRCSKGGYVSTRDRYMKVVGNLGCIWYSGKVWCPRTGTGTWLMRRNGKVIFTGNTYTRKAAPMLLQKMFENPNAFRIYGEATGKIGGGDGGLAQDSLPDWIRRASPISMGMKDEQGRDRFLMGNLPPDTLMSFQDHPLQTALSNLSILPRAIGEIGSGTNFATGRPLNGPSANLQSLLGPETTKQLSPLLKLEPYTPLSRFAGTVNRLGQAIGGDDTGSRTVGDQLAGLLGFPGYRNDADQGRKMREADSRHDILDRLYDAGRAKKVYDYSSKDEDAKAIQKLIRQAQSQRKKESAK